jgi:ankyrin
MEIRTRRGVPAGEETMGGFETFVDSVNHGRVEELKELLARDPAMVHRKKDGATPLHLAAIHNQRGIADVLLDHGAPLEATDDEFGMTPIGWANERGHVEMVRHLYARGAAVGLARAAAYGLEERVRELLDAGTEDVNRPEGFGTPLHFASLWGHPAIVELLLDRGADPARKTKQGRTALAVAVHQVESGGRDTPIALEPRRSEIVAGCAKVAEILRGRAAPA